MDVQAIICKCGCPLRDHRTNRSCQMNDEIGSRHCSGFAVATPEIEKMDAVVDRSQEIGAFMEWLQEQRIFLAQYHRHTTGCEAPCDINENRLWPYPYTMETVLARYFEIDLTKVETEKREILEAHRFLTGVK